MVLNIKDPETDALVRERRRRSDPSVEWIMTLARAIDADVVDREFDERFLYDARGLPA